MRANPITEAIIRQRFEDCLSILHENAIGHLLQIKEIYLEPEVFKYQRGIDILTKYLDAQLTEFVSHWKIPELFGFEESVED